MILLLLRVVWLHAVSISSRLPCGRMLVLVRGSRNIHADNTLGTIVWGLGLVRTEKRTLSKVVNNHASVNGRFNIRANAAKQASCIAARTSEKWPKSMDLLCTKKNWDTILSYLNLSKCLGLLLPQPRPSLLGAYLQQHPNLPGMLRNPNPFTVKG